MHAILFIYFVLTHMQLIQKVQTLTGVPEGKIMH